MPDCHGLPNKIRQLCRTLVDRYHVAPDAIDQGAPYVDYTQGRQPVLKTTGVGEGDGAYSEQEVLQAAVWLARDQFVKNHGAAPIVADLQKILSIHVPLILDDRNPRTTTDQILIRATLDTCDGIAHQLVRRGFVEGTSAYALAAANELLDFFRSDAGLNLRGRPVLHQATPAMATRLGTLNCLDYTALYYSGALLCGLEPSIVLEYNAAQRHVARVDNNKFAVDHVVVAVHIDPQDRSQRLFVDPSIPYADMNEGDATWVELPPLEFMTAYYLNRAEFNYTGERNTKKRLLHEWRNLQIAKQLSPQSYAVELSIGHWQWRNGNRRGAARHFQAARVLNPYLP